jgi:hypothetical protein
VDENPDPWTARQLRTARRLDGALSEPRYAIRSVLGLLAFVVATFGLLGRVGHIFWGSIVVIMVIDLGRLAALRLRRGASGPS